MHSQAQLKPIFEFSSKQDLLGVQFLGQGAGGQVRLYKVINPEKEALLIENKLIEKDGLLAIKMPIYLDLNPEQARRKAEEFEGEIKVADHLFQEYLNHLQDEFAPSYGLATGAIIDGHLCLISRYEKIKDFTGSAKDFVIDLAHKNDPNLDIIIPQIIVSLYRSLLCIHNAGVLHSDIAVRNTVIEAMLHYTNDSDQKIPYFYRAKFIDYGHAMGRDRLDNNLSKQVTYCRKMATRWLDTEFHEKHVISFRTDLYAFKIMVSELIEAAIEGGRYNNRPFDFCARDSKQFELLKILSNSERLSKLYDYLAIKINEELDRIYIESAKKNLLNSLKELLNSLKGFMITYSDKESITASHEKDTKLLTESMENYFINVLLKKLSLFAAQKIASRDLYHAMMQLSVLPFSDSFKANNEWYLTMMRFLNEKEQRAELLKKLIQLKNIVVNDESTIEGGSFSIHENSQMGNSLYSSFDGSLSASHDKLPASNSRVVSTNLNLKAIANVKIQYEFDPTAERKEKNIFEETQAVLYPFSTPRDRIDKKQAESNVHVIKHETYEADVSVIKHESYEMCEQDKKKSGSGIERKKLVRKSAIYGKKILEKEIAQEKNDTPGMIEDKDKENNKKDKKNKRRSLIATLFSQQNVLKEVSLKPAIPKKGN